MLGISSFSELPLASLPVASTGPVAYSLSGAAGSYTLTGQAATLTYAPGTSATNYTLSGANGSYALTGQAASFKRGYALGGANGSYSYSGIAASFKRGYGLSGASGSYSFTGKAATLTYTPGSGAVAYTLSGANGSYLFSGQSATFTVTTAEAARPPRGAGRGSNLVKPTRLDDADVLEIISIFLALEA